MSERIFPIPPIPPNEMNFIRQLVLTFALGLSACAPIIISRVEERPDPTTMPPAGEVTDAPAGGPEPTEEAPTELPPTPEANPLHTQIDQEIKSNPYYETAYVQAVIETGENIPENCIAMVEELIKNREIAAIDFVDVGINANGICYVTWEEDGVRTVVFDNKDSLGYLYVEFDPAKHPEGAVFDWINTFNGFWAQIRVDGQITKAVDGITGIWREVVDGKLVDSDGQPTAAPTMTPENVSATESKTITQTLNREAIELLVSKYLAGSLTNLSELTPEQRAAFDEVLQDHPEMTAIIEKRAQQVMDGTMTMEEAREGLSIERQIDLSQKLIEMDYPQETYQPNIFDLARKEKVPNWPSVERSSIALPCTINENGYIVYRKEGQLITTSVKPEFFAVPSSEFTELAEHGSGGVEVAADPYYVNILGLQGKKFPVYMPGWTGSSSTALFPGILVTEASEQTIRGAWNNALNQTLAITGPQLAVPYWPNGTTGDMRYLRTIDLLMLTRPGVRQNRAPVAGGWEDSKNSQPGINPKAIQSLTNSCLGPNNEGRVIIVEGSNEAIVAALEKNSGEESARVIKDNSGYVYFIEFKGYFCWSEQ